MSITMWLQGGLCNQIWQYAFGLACARRLNTDLVLDVTSYDTDPLRRFQLELFPGLSKDTSIVKGSRTTICERGLPYDQTLVDNVKDGDCLRGYFQCERYFETVKDEMRERLKINPEDHPESPLVYLKSFAIAGRPNSVFVSVRRGDYLQKQNFHGVLPPEYYQDAVKTIKWKVGSDAKYFVVSDDPKWCQENMAKILGGPTLVIGSFDQTTPERLGSEHFDLHLASLCRHAILSNGSFAWWGAWLGGDDPDRVIVAPKQWFTTTEVDGRDIVPARWVKV